MPHFNLTKTDVKGKPARYYANGTRISKTAYEEIQTLARMNGLHDSFHGKIKGDTMRLHSCARW